MFLGLREHEMRSNPCIIEVKIPFDPNIMKWAVAQFSEFDSRERSNRLIVLAHV